MTNPNAPEGRGSDQSKSAFSRGAIVQFSLLALCTVVMALVAVGYRNSRHDARQQASQIPAAPEAPVEVKSNVDDGVDED